MRVAVLGKRGSITGWTESTVAGLRWAGHDVLACVTRDPRIAPAVESLFYAPGLGAIRVRGMLQRIAAFRPDLVLVVRAFDTPLAVLQAVRAWPGRAPAIGWVGDRFDASMRERAACFDLIGYTDSALMALHEQLGFASSACFLPHAVDPAKAQPPATGIRDKTMVFVASPTPHRAAMVRQVTSPLRLIGAKWDRFAGPPHEIEARRVPPAAVAEAYARHAAVLNIRNEINTVSGLNQRGFQPYLAGAAVVSDDQPDLDRCFERGREILVYSGSAELNQLYARLRRDPAIAARIAEAGRRRVLAEHSFAARLREITRRI